jgi:hypothetical protein
MGFGVVDVRDVAAAHCLAAFTPTAKGRHLLAPSSAWITDMLAVVHSKYPKVAEGMNGQGMSWRCIGSR